MAKKKEKTNKNSKAEDKNTVLNNFLDKMTTSGMQKTKQWVDMWQLSLRYFFGEQLAGKIRHKNWDWIVVNYIWPTAMQEIAKLSKNFPRIIAQPWEDSDVEAAEAWQSKLQWDWEQGFNKRGMRLDQIAAILDGKLFGYRVSKVFWEDKVKWNEEAQEWEGDVKHKLWHPALFWASDEEHINDGDCGTERYVSLDWAISRWPDFEDELKLEAQKFHQEHFGRPTVRGSKSTGTTAALASGVFPGGSESETHRTDSNMIVSLVTASDVSHGNGQGVPKEEEVVKLQEIYFRDLDSESVTEKENIPIEELITAGVVFQQGDNFVDEKGSVLAPEDFPTRTVREYKKPKFPNGRFIVRVGRTVLNPKQEDQVYPHSQWPFVVTPHYLLPHMWQGVNAVELYRSPQDLINISVSHLFNNMKLFGDPKIAVENDAMAVNPRTKKAFRIGAGPGAIIRLVRGGLSRFKILDPPSTSTGAALLYQLFVNEFKNMTGIQNIASGKRDEGRTTATQSQLLAISSHDRIALQAAYEDEWVRRVCILDAEISQLHYDVGRYIRIIGEDKAVGAQQITEKMKDVRFDVNIESSSQIPFDAEKELAKKLQAYQLLNNPTPNPLLPDILRELGINNWKKILAQHSAWQSFIQLQQLFEGVKSGQIPIEEAVKLITQRLTQMAQQESQGNIIGGQEVPRGQ